MVARGAIGFLLFCANGAYKFDVGDIFEAVAGFFIFGYEFNGVGTLDASPDTLCKASKFIGSRNVPGVFDPKIVDHQGELDRSGGVFP